MDTNPSPKDKPNPSSPRQDDARPVQTGALSGGQPGQGVNTSSSAAGQSNVDAATREGVEYGKHDRERRGDSASGRPVARVEGAGPPNTERIDSR